MNFFFKFLEEVTNIDKIYKMLNEFNNEINEIKNDYLAGQDEEIDDVTKYASLVYNNQLNFFDEYILKNKTSPPRTLTKRKSAEKLIKSKPRLLSEKRFSSSPSLSISFPPRLYQVHHKKI